MNSATPGSATAQVFERKPYQVVALRWDGTSFALFERNPHFLRSDQDTLCLIGLDGPQTVQVGDWVVRDPQGVYSLLDAATFLQFFREAHA